ncbi:FO synthase [Kineosphaera limosa]|uniref:FO synthase n=1 Tax=Kineosphaera limosa NBRC 100340 TaxID=1184609 RepID=K6WBA4_9MICO|nr:bifunctional FO biosynthesis protein CofGH [Kineosphaera limosa]NYD99125.1 FO synthase [Kineosphaera limosa]GAB96515.1 7,8-didemethyl-8-hydroxy-5-deazariboflavin synthase [Kineosphaera limosa NBRC 100340]
MSGKRRLTPGSVARPEEPTPQEMRRALARARDGKALDAGEAQVLLHARGDDLARLCAAATRVRDAAMVAAGRPGVVTYSPKVFIPLTRLCRDRCHYCTFATTPGRVEEPFLAPEQVLQIARAGAAAGCAEALFTLGDRPETRWKPAREWLDAHGYDDTLSYVRAMAILVLEETGLLPHLNPGVMSWAELTRLAPVAPSLGMMLETTSRRLFETPGQAHFGSPDKDPDVRLRVLTDAGRIGIPFTTGLLVGIGETPAERVETILAIRAAARESGAIQECIVQNFRAKGDTAMRGTPDLEHEAYLATIAVTRLLLGPSVSVQAPPNLSGLAQLPDLLAAGVDDLGGISPVTADHVNPERPWPQLDALAAQVQAAGLQLKPRLTAHARYVRDSLNGTRPWIDPRLHAHVAALASPDGLLADGARPQGRPWQEPDGGFGDGASGRVDLHQEVDTSGRTDDRRSDFDSVYGDWAAVAAASRRIGTEAAGKDAGNPTRLARYVEADVAAAMRRAEANPAGLSDDDYLTLMTAEGAGLEAVCALADGLRKDTVGDDVTYVVNRNINFSNVCYVGCRFCAFAQRAQDADAYRLSLQQLTDRAREAQSVGATELCLQGGIDPQLGRDSYTGIVRAVREGAPGIHVHAFSPMEIVTASAKAGVSITDWLSEVKEAGLGSIPGTAAEILDDDVRWVLTKGKLPTSAWIDVVSTAHRLGIPSTSTMMYGHVDHPRHWVAHLRTLAAVQDETGGFTEFVPLPFVHTNAPVYLAGIARPGPTLRDNRAVHALARIMLHGRIDNIQCSWVKLGVDGTRTMLRGGANDLGGTLMEETISRMAGSQHGSAKTPEEIAHIAAGIGRPAVQRGTLYERVAA